MSMLLNRKYGSRLECLYYILKSRYNKYGINKKFVKKSFLFDESDTYNVHKYCELLISIVGRKCCPYLDNPLKGSKCYATQSIEEDTTKEKAVSDICGSLEALGFIQESGNEYTITTDGEKWINTDYNSKEWYKLTLKGVLSYGVVIGFLYKIAKEPDVFISNNIYISYPHTEEEIDFITDNGLTKKIKISTDSQKDSNTRTITKIVNWCVTVGLIEPYNYDFNNSTLPQVKYKKFLTEKKLTSRKFRKTDFCKKIFDKKLFVDNPLSFDRLTKNVGSLRESGQKDIRVATIQSNYKIKARRFCFIYVLNYFSEKNLCLNFNLFLDEMKKYGDNFFSNIDEANDIMSTEIEIAFIAGIPFNLDENGNMKPLTIINTKILTKGASENILNLTNKIISELENDL